MSTLVLAGLIELTANVGGEENLPFSNLQLKEQTNGAYTVPTYWIKLSNVQKPVTLSKKVDFPSFM